MSAGEWTVLQSVALASLLAWASGLRLYLVIFAVGMAGYLDYVDLPKGLEVLKHPWVLGAAGFMLLMEFLADKVPVIDSAWDAVHTFIRIPAGALLAAGAVGEVTPALEIAAGILGGGMAATSHVTKAGTRLLINTSPEPFSNWTASVAEDVAVFGGLWAALNQPWLFIALLVAFLVLVAWLMPKVFRALRKVGGGILRLLGRRPRAPAADPPASIEHK